MINRGNILRQTMIGRLLRRIAPKTGLTFESFCLCRTSTASCVALAFPACLAVWIANYCGFFASEALRVHLTLVSHSYRESETFSLCGRRWLDLVGTLCAPDRSRQARGCDRDVTIPCIYQVLSVMLYGTTRC